jgi:hypothetical protein
MIRRSVGDADAVVHASESASTNGASSADPTSLSMTRPASAGDDGNFATAVTI